MNHNKDPKLPIRIFAVKITAAMTMNHNSIELQPIPNTITLQESKESGTSSETKASSGDGTTSRRGGGGTGALGAAG